MSDQERIEIWWLDCTIVMGNNIEFCGHPTMSVHFVLAGADPNDDEFWAFPHHRVMN